MNGAALPSPSGNANHEGMLDRLRQFSADSTETLDIKLQFALANICRRGRIPALPFGFNFALKALAVAYWRTRLRKTAVGVGWLAKSGKPHRSFLGSTIAAAVGAVAWKRRLLRIPAVGIASMDRRGDNESSTVTNIRLREGGIVVGILRWPARRPDSDKRVREKGGVRAWKRTEATFEVPSKNVAAVPRHGPRGP